MLISFDQLKSFASQAKALRFPSATVIFFVCEECFSEKEIEPCFSLSIVAHKIFFTKATHRKQRVGRNLWIMVAHRLLTKFFKHDSALLHKNCISLVFKSGNNTCQSIPLIASTVHVCTRRAFWEFSKTGNGMWWNRVFWLLEKKGGVLFKIFKKRPVVCENIRLMARHTLISENVAPNKPAYQWCCD